VAPRARLTHRPDDGGSKDLWNVGKLLPDYTVLQPRRQSLRTHRRENLKSYAFYFISERTVDLNDTCISCRTCFWNNNHYYLLDIYWLKFNFELNLSWAWNWSYQNGIRPTTFKVLLHNSCTKCHRNSLSGLGCEICTQTNFPIKRFLQYLQTKSTSMWVPTAIIPKVAFEWLAFLLPFRESPG
jgi:hypothetical protein